MFKNFWFYFNFLPVLFSLLFITINLFYFWYISKDYIAPRIDDAIVFCKDVSNDHWADYERTYQDKCIDEFMGGKEIYEFEISWKEMLWWFCLILSLIGLLFILPLIIFLYLSWIKCKK